MRDVRVEVSVLGIDESEGDHRYVFGRRISNVERESVCEGDASTVPFGRQEQALIDLESLDKVPALGFRGLEIIFFRVSENEIEGQEPGLDVSEFVLPPIAEIVFADGGVELPRAEVIDETPAGVPLGAGMTKTEQFFDQSGIALAALGACKVQKLPHGEVAGMRCHKGEKPGFHFGVAEVEELGELVLWDIHGLKAQNCRTQLPVVADTAKTVCLAMPGIDLKAGASLLGEPARAVVFRGKLKVAPLNLVFVLVHILDTQVGNGNLAGHNLQVIPLGNFFSKRFRVATPVLGNVCEAGIKFLLYFVVELDAKYFAAAALDLIADLVIEPIEVGVVKSFVGFLESVVGGLI
jgi:hypothetical protein